MSTVNLMRDEAAPATGEWKSAGDAGETGGIRSVQVGLAGQGALTAVIEVEGCNDGRFPFKIATFTLSGNDSVTDAIELRFPWENFRVKLVSISGTRALASAVMRV